MPHAEAEAFIEPVIEFCDGLERRHGRSKGVAIFRSKDRLRIFDADPTDEGCFIEHRFHVRPIVPAIGTTSFYILSISQNQVSLHLATGNNIVEVDVPGMPTSFATELADVTADRGSQIHSSGIVSAGKQGAVFHGQGGHHETEKAELIDYCRRVDQAIRPILRDKPRPVILAGVDELTAMMHQADDGGRYCEMSISGNVDRDPDHVLFEKAASVIADHNDAQLAEISKRFVDPRRQRVASDSEQILCAAFEGRVDTLIVDQNAKLVGRYYPVTKTIQELRDRPTDNPLEPNHDLVELAIAQTLIHRGNVISVTHDKMPLHAKIAATLRY